MSDAASLENPITAPSDLTYHRRFWLVQRVWWAILAAFILLASLGLFGEGPISSTTATAGDLQFEHERFVHADTPTRLRIMAPSPGDEITIALSLNYIRSVVVEQVTPQADSVEAGSDVLLYTFAASAGGGPVTVDFIVSPASNGLLEGYVEAAGERISFSQFVYP